MAPLILKTFIRLHMNELKMKKNCKNLKEVSMYMLIKY